MVKYEQLDKECVSLLLKALDMKNVKCKFCKKRIRKDNFGLINNKVISCRDILCLTQAIDIVEKDEEETKAK